MLVYHRKEVLEELGYGVGTQEGIYGASNYQNVLGVLFMNDLDSMLYEMICEY